jgi:hypothetical protein
VGKFIVCRTCNEHGPEITEREKKGSISVRQPFWCANVRMKEFFESEDFKKPRRNIKSNPFSFLLNSLEDLGAKLLVQTKFVCASRQE